MWVLAASWFGFLNAMRENLYLKFLSMFIYYTPQYANVYISKQLKFVEFTFERRAVKTK